MDSLLPQTLPDAGEETAVMPRISEVFNITEAAAFLGAHEQTVRRLARRGGIPAFMVELLERTMRSVLGEKMAPLARGTAP